MRCELCPASFSPTPQDTFYCVLPCGHDGEHEGETGGFDEPIYRFTFSSTDARGEAEKKQ